MNKSLKYRTLHFHGPSGAGKDTQLDLLEKVVDFERIGASDIMRALKAENHPLALEAEEYGKRGELYPDEIVYGMLEEWLARLDSNKPWFFSSTVRNVNQIPLFDDLLKKFGRELELFIHFSLSEKAAVERLSLRWICPKCNTAYHENFKKEQNKGFCDKDNEKLIQRDDDKPEQIKVRMGWYQENIKPILDEYNSRKILLEIDASPSIEDIHKELTAKLGLPSAV